MAFVDQVSLEAVQPASPAPLLRGDTSPICIARPENPGIANVRPVHIEIRDQGFAVDLIGGVGMCFWGDFGKHTVLLSWEGINVSEKSSVSINLKRGSTVRLNVCLTSLGGAKIGYALRKVSEHCDAGIG